MSYDRDYSKNAITKPNLKMAARQLSAYWVQNNSKEVSIFEIELSPNPTKSDINIISTGQIIQTLRIFDITGNIVLKDCSLNSNMKTINLINLNAGVYFLEAISLSGISKVYKIVKL